MQEIDFNDVIVIALGTALGMVVGEIAKGMLAKSSYGAKFGLAPTTKTASTN